MRKYISALFKRFSAPQPISRKAYLSLGGYFAFDYGTLLPIKALAYYTQIAPLYTGINMIATEVAALNTILVNKNSDDLITDSPILDLLNNPNADCTGDEFMAQITSFYKLTGNAFIVASGPVNKPALELTVVNPLNVVIEPDYDGYPTSITVVSALGQTTRYNRFEVKGRFRFFADDSEIWHIKAFSPRYAAGELLGMSDLSPIALELDQYYEASVHNLSLLKRGARPSGAIKTQGFLTDDQYQRMQDQLENFYSGSQNAGRALILDSSDFIPMSQSMKDMDFATLKKEVTNTIYNALRIPLPMINAEFSSYNNLETSKLNFYDNAILPTAQRLYEELTVFLMDRYDKTGKFKLYYDQSAVSALEPRKNAEILKLKESGVLTFNEIRSKMGYDAVDGGDTLYIPYTMQPLGALPPNYRIMEEDVDKQDTLKPEPLIPPKPKK